MAGNKCKNCGSSEIEEDSARGDAVCMNCGTVLESTLIVSEVQFQDTTNGASSAIGQFVSSESKGGGCGSFGNSFHMGMGTESREITLKKARQGITMLCTQLNLSQHYIDTACNFFKMALTRHLTRGRRNTHVFAACVYITCRTSGTSHLLIDISDALQICGYELGRTYLRLSKALCINIPSVDPCIYILRFANKLGLGAKTQQVTTTALRLVQRMKRDSIHSGRRPAGLCGAALLMAARLHDFSRSPGDIVKIVKVHESTLRKRLFEFGDTPSSMLTLEEFMNVDLEEEQDPPAFKVARKKDKERLMKLEENCFDMVDKFREEIDEMLETNQRKKHKFDISALNIPMVNDGTVESEETNQFIQESTLGSIKEVFEADQMSEDSQIEGIAPSIKTLGLEVDETKVSSEKKYFNAENVRLDDLDDDEIDSYIMTDNEARMKDTAWHKLNAKYLEEQKVKLERLAKEKEEGKPEKKRRRSGRRKNNQPAANTVGEAVEKMLKEKKISSKINYEVVKSLNETFAVKKPLEIHETDGENSDVRASKRKKECVKIEKLSQKSTELIESSAKRVKTLDESADVHEDVEVDDYYVEDELPEKAPVEVSESLFDKLRDYHRNDDDDDAPMFGHDDDAYDEDY